MFYAYVLKSIGHDYYYKGHCQDLEKRLIQHNSGMTTSIKSYIPFEVIYYGSGIKCTGGRFIFEACFIHDKEATPGFASQFF